MIMTIVVMRILMCCHYRLEVKALPRTVLTHEVHYVANLV